MVDEIEYVILAYNPKELYYDDDIINGNARWLESFCDLKINRKADIPFTCMGHVLISTKLLDKMKAAGCQGSKFGVESADNTVLRRLGKGMTIEIVEVYSAVLPRYSMIDGTRK